jgi:regulator of replication initiation timing
VADESNSGSIVSEVDKRLDDIFGKDEGGSMFLESVTASPLDELRGLMLIIDREISQETITALNTEVKQLENFYATDTHVLALLKIISLLVGYMKLEKADIHPDTTNLLTSAFQCMESVAENKGISTHEKIALIKKEIDSFNKFKVNISSGGKPAAKKKASRTGETGTKGSELAPTAEPPLAAVPLGEIFTALDDLRSFMGGKLAALKNRVDGLKETFTSSDDSGAHLTEELKALKSRMDDLRGLPNDFDNMRGQLFEEFMTLKGQVNNLEGEVSRLRDDLRSVRSELEVIRGAVCQVRAAPLSDESAQEEAGMRQVEESPGNSEATDGELSEHDIIVVGESSADEPQELQTDGEATSEDGKSEDREEEAFDSSHEQGEPEAESPTSGSYFLFQMGGRKYAVDEANVIKRSKANRRLLKMASDKGGLTMIDCRRMFSGIKRGIEPAWSHLCSKDLERTTFPLLTDDRIDGLLDTNGGGMLFLGSGEKRSMLFTDRLPKKQRFSRKNKVKSLPGSGYVHGAIQKSGDSAEYYPVLDADQLCRRLRVSIPAPFTKI